jgi:hypothetical protein
MYSPRIVHFCSGTAALLLVIPGWPEGTGPEPMNTDLP